MRKIKTTYIWLFLRLIGTFIVAISLTSIVLETIAKPSIIPLIGFSFLLCISGLLSIRLAFNRASFMRLLKAEILENRLEAFHLLIWPFVFIGAFALICAQLNSFFPVLFAKSGSSIQPNDWIIFAVDQAVRAVFLDLLETYKIHISSIDYIREFWIASFVFIFKTVLEVFFWKFIINFFIGWKPTINEMGERNR